MTSGTTTLDTAAILAAARRARATANAAEAEVLAQAVGWSHLHQVTDPDNASTVLVEHGHDTGIPIAGDGAPFVSEFAVAEFASGSACRLERVATWSGRPSSSPTDSRNSGLGSRRGRW